MLLINHGREAYFEDARVRAGAEDHLGRAQDRLGGELHGYLPGETVPDTSVRKGLDEHEHVRRARARQARDGVEMLLLDGARGADRGEERLHESPVRLRRIPPQRVRRSGRIHRRRGVGHAAHLGIAFQMNIYCFGRKEKKKDSRKRGKIDNSHTLIGSISFLSTLFSFLHLPDIT